jgi:hypothetical protein
MSVGFSEHELVPFTFLLTCLPSLLSAGAFPLRKDSTFQTTGRKIIVHMAASVILPGEGMLKYENAHFRQFVISLLVQSGEKV